MMLTNDDKKYLLEKIYGGIKQTFEEDLPQIEEADVRAGFRGFPVPLSIGRRCVR